MTAPDPGFASPWRQRLLWAGLGFLVASAGFALFSLRDSGAPPASAPSSAARPAGVPGEPSVGAVDRKACYLGVVLASDAVEVVAEIDRRLQEIAGRAALRYLDGGAIASAGTPVVRLISSGGLLTRFAMPPEEALELSVGMPVRVEIETAGLAVPGTVGHIAPEIDSASQMVFVEAQLSSEAPQRIPARATARVSVLGAGEPPASCLKS